MVSCRAIEIADDEPRVIESESKAFFVGTRRDIESTVTLHEIVNLAMSDVEDAKRRES